MLMELLIMTRDGVVTRAVMARLHGAFSLVSRNIFGCVVCTVSTKEVELKLQALG